MALLNTSQDSTTHHQCLVCYSDLTHPAKAACGHNGICGICHLRLRHLHADRACPMCKHVNEQLIVDEFDTNKPFEEYPMWGNELGEHFVYRQDVGMFFSKQHYDVDILPLFGYACTSCKDYDGIQTEADDTQQQQKQKQQQQQQNKKKLTPLRALQDHLRIKHRQTLCELCVDFKRDFVAKLPRFSPAHLKRHHQHGDGVSSGFSGHPLCEFCRPTRFYDLTHLHLHLQKDHYKCHVCEKQGLANQFFRNYDTLEQHFDRKHFLCKDPQCVAARFMVFENDLDFRHHNLSTHGTSGTSTKINLEFRVRREGYDGSGYESNQQSVPSDQDFGFGVDGQAFVPESLPQPREPTAETAHPQHFTRTAELRAQAQEIRQQMESQVDAFPTLAESLQSDGPIRTGWTADGVASRVARMPQATTSQEQFPSLPSIKSSKIATKFKQGTVSNSRNAISKSVTNANWNQAVAATAPPAFASRPVSTASTMATNSRSNLASDNFPSLGAPSVAAPKPYSAAQQLATKKQAPAFNTMNFPPPPTATRGSSVRQQTLAPAPPRLDQMHFPSPAVTVDTIKAILGPDKYKALKKLTKEFAVDAIAPHEYVDRAVCLFDNGYGDSDFWAVVPSLLLSCPNASGANRATRYMDTLRASVVTESWAEPVLTNNYAPPAAATIASRSNVGIPVRNTNMANKKPSAWGAGSGASTTLLVGSAKGSVAVAAANQKPSVGTATKAMAREQKQIKQAAAQQLQQTSNDGKKKKKNANELRDLAFGR